MTLTTSDIDRTLWVLKYWVTITPTSWWHGMTTLSSTAHFPYPQLAPVDHVYFVKAEEVDFKHSTWEACPFPKCAHISLACSRGHAAIHPQQPTCSTPRCQPICIIDGARSLICKHKVQHGWRADTRRAINILGIMHCTIYTERKWLQSSTTCRVSLVVYLQSCVCICKCHLALKIKLWLD